MDAAKEAKELRALIDDCIAKRSYATAAFYADKLVSFTKFENISDVYLLATCYFHLKQYKKVVSFLQKVSFSSDM